MMKPVLTWWVAMVSSDNVTQFLQFLSATILSRPLWSALIMVTVPNVLLPLASWVNTTHFYHMCKVRFLTHISYSMKTLVCFILHVTKVEWNQSIIHFGKHCHSPTSSFQLSLIFFTSCFKKWWSIWSLGWLAFLRLQQSTYNAEYSHPITRFYYLQRI